MLKWFNELINADSSKSSARFLNVFGGLVFGGVYIAEFIIRREINIEATQILALYFASVYGTSGLINWAKGKLEVRKDV